MAFEELKAQIGLLLGEMNEQPEDLHELYQQIHQELNQLRATGMALPADLVELEQRLLKEFPDPPTAEATVTAGLHPPHKSRQKPRSRRRGRVAEGNGLLNRHTLSRRIEGSNPSVSAPPVFRCSPLVTDHLSSQVFSRVLALLFLPVFQPVSP